tara:strand:+ start:811 stop:1116 length:306 start_codon:yes stop_codon:yes gene_type:complete
MITIYYLIAGCILSFLVGVTAHARVSAFKKKLIDLDWDTVAGLATDVAIIKKRLQKMQAVENGSNHGRVNELAIMQQLAAIQPQGVKQGNGVLTDNRPRSG